jgi:hypothetical protein
MAARERWRGVAAVSVALVRAWQRWGQLAEASGLIDQSVGSVISGAMS